MLTHTGAQAHLFSVTVLSGTSAAAEEGAQPPPRSVEPLRRRTTGPTIEAAIESYLADCRQRNHSHATLKSYHCLLMGARGRTFQEKSGSTHLADLADATWFRGFLLYLRDLGLTASYQHTYFRTWHSMLVWCAGQGWLDERALVFKVKPPRLPRQEPVVITEAQEAYLLGAAHCERDRFLIRFMIRTGLRREEVRNLDVDDIVTSPSGGRLVRVRRGKGGKDRRVPLDTGGVRFSDDVDSYLARVRPASSDPALFLTRDRLNGWGGLLAKRREEPERLSAHGLYQIFKRLREETGIDVSPHKLRHTFATRAIASGTPTFALQEALGHTTLEMTKRYVHYSTEHLEAAWRERKD